MTSQRPSGSLFIGTLAATLLTKEVVATSLEDLTRAITCPDDHKMFTAGYNFIYKKFGQILNYCTKNGFLSHQA
jgi:hypothetical protein